MRPLDTTLTKTGILDSKYLAPIDASMRVARIDPTTNKVTAIYDTIREAAVANGTAYQDITHFINKTCKKGHKSVPTAPGGFHWMRVPSKKK